MAIKKTPTGSVFQFLIELRDIKPKIWRRIQVPNMTLHQLHECIQSVMGWSNTHLHYFEIEQERYSDPESFNDGYDDDVDEEHDTNNVELESLLIRAKKSFRFDYLYDFGDHWDHRLTFEGAIPSEPGATYPRCLEGKRACPPEDCGGPPGFADLLEALANPKHTERQRYLEWANDYDPNEFSCDEATNCMQQGAANWD